MVPIMSPLSRAFTRVLLRQAMAGRPLWTLDADGGKIRRSFVAKSFVAAMDFMNKVAEIAEHEGVRSLCCPWLPPISE